MEIRCLSLLFRMRYLYKKQPISFALPEGKKLGRLVLYFLSQIQFPFLQFDVLHRYLRVFSFTSLIN